VKNLVAFESSAKDRHELAYAFDGHEGGDGASGLAHVGHFPGVSFQDAMPEATPTTSVTFDASMGPRATIARRLFEGG